MRYGIALLLLFVSAFAAAQEPLRVGVKESPPFVVKEGTYWTGTSIDIVDGIARDLDRQVEYVEFETVSQILKAVEDGEVDMSISAITITADREATVDFSYPYFSTGPGVLTRANTSYLELAITIGGKVLGILFGLICLLYFVGWIADKIDGDGTIHNAHEGAWWALVTFSTTGYGDLVPETARGKVVAASWIIASLFLCSLFTGYVSSSMTVKRLSDSPTTINDLHNSTVIAIEGTTGAALLESKDVQHFTVRTLSEAMELFHNKKADAFVYDETMLEHVSAGNDAFEVWSLGESTEFYGIALPEGSELKEPIDVSILRQTQN